jgi:RHS repeat-associated protein
MARANRLTTDSATSVTVNGQSATLYADKSFALANLALADTAITAVAQDGQGQSNSHAIHVGFPPTVAFQYDTSGNLTNDGRRVFSYDNENQLVGVVVSNGVNQLTQTGFVYDGRMRRRIRTEATWQSGGWVTNQVLRYVYDGHQVIQERDGNNVSLVSYTRGLDLSSTLEGAGGIGGILARTHHASPNHHFFYHADGNGNVTAIINEAQNVVAEYQYDPFGNMLSARGALAEGNLYRFSSKEYHPASGLYYYGYRFYDPYLQRWLNRDPMQERGGLNLYSLLGNDSVNRLDSFGLFTNRGRGEGGGPEMPYPSNPANPYPEGFAMCQRNVAVDGPSDSVGKCCNSFGGEHTYLQYVRTLPPPYQGPPFVWGWGFSGGTKTVREKAFNPSHCKSCSKNGSSLMYGSGAGKSSTSASDIEIRDCIMNRKPTRRYSFPTYVCTDWAEEAAKDCGLTCK